MSNLVILTKVGGQDPIYDVVCPASTIGGGVLVLGARNSNGTYAAAANGAITDAKMAIVAPVCLPYDDSLTEHDYVIITGAIERAYIPVKGRTYDIPVANITATVAVAVGKFVVPKATEIPMECKNAVGGTETIQFEVKEIYSKAGVSYASLLCIKDQ
jgi:hypothetical protein